MSLKGTLRILGLRHCLAVLDQIDTHGRCSPPQPQEGCRQHGFGGGHLFLGGTPVGAFLGRVVNGLTRRLQTRLGGATIDVGDRHRFLGEHRQATVGDLGEAAGDKHLIADGIVLVDVEDAGANGRQQGRVPGQDAEVAVSPRDDDHLGLFRRQQARRRDEIEGECVRHRSLASYAASSAMRCAFSTASSMVPTM